MNRSMSEENFDLVVVGCGAAGLAAALGFLEAAAERGLAPTVAILERSGEADRGGATRWSWVNVMVDPDGVVNPSILDRVLDLDPAFDREYFDTLRRLGGDSVEWMRSHGVTVTHAAPPFAMESDYGAVEGGGLSLVNAFAARIEAYPGSTFFYDTEATRLTEDDRGRVNGVVVRGPDGLTRTVGAGGVVLASGGFEGNYQMLTQHVGARAGEIRPVAPGLRHNLGDGLRMATDVGGTTAGQFDMLHVELVDPRSDKPDPGIFGAPYGIMVNQDGERFIDEGSRTFEGINEQLAWTVWRDQGNLAYFVYDAEMAKLPGFAFLNQTDVPPYEGTTVEELGEAMGVDPDKLAATVASFNAAVCPGEFDPSTKDGKRTTGLEIDKTNWAMPVSEPPFRAFPGSAAVTFCFGGIRTDTRARVLTGSGTPIPNLYAAGVATGVWYQEYPGALSVLRSVTFGRIAGREVADALDA
ncbi:FAD-binding protein [Amycolatopsis orientalis]|uniref:FAD-binding protein n=1 Tax=Amycolatopsis orientalis TaxID=31958 RepID=UPI000686AE95|nr:FAD-binding protein [Amycolatopsis orientalis]